MLLMFIKISVKLVYILDTTLRISKDKIKTEGIKMKKVTLLLAAIATMTSANPIVEDESYSHNKRISILQEADACIKNAKSKEAYRVCEKKEQEARSDLRKEMKQRKLVRLDSRIANMQEGKRKENMINMRNCLSAANTKEEHQSCRAKYGKKRF